MHNIVQMNEPIGAEMACLVSPMLESYLQRCQDALDPRIALYPLLIFRKATLELV